MKNQFSQINNRLLQINNAILQAMQRFGRSQNSCELLAVSKGQSISKIEAAVLSGQRKFGENYVQEALLKIQSLRVLEVEWHFIGSIQRNKAKQIAENFNWVHSVDGKNIAQRLSDQRPSHLAPLNVCLQVNLMGESQKSGVLPSEVLGLAAYVNDLPKIHLRGLMAIPPVTEVFSEQRKLFGQLRELKETIIKKNIFLDTLSMGTSHDFEAAIAEGATLVRIGSAIFGKRERRA